MIKLLSLAVHFGKIEASVDVSILVVGLVWADQ